MTMIIAHRGASAAEPENTIAAFQRAVEMGAEGIELDVRRSADDQLIVHHDAHLGDGRSIRSLRRSELPSAVPTLADALDACAGAFVNVEIKNDRTEPDYDESGWLAVATTVELLRRNEPMRWLISSFDLATVDRCRVVLPGVRTALLTEQPLSQAYLTAAARRHVAIHPWVANLDEASIREAHVVGLAVNTWTVDDPDMMRNLMAWGVDGICTNVPDVALAVRREMLGR